MTATSRRQLLRYLASSPLAYAAASLSGAFPGGLEESEALIEVPRDAVNVFDFRSVARNKLTAAHYAYLSTGVDEEVTLRANREGFERFALRPRRLVDVRKLSKETTLLGTDLASPIVLAPAASQKAYHAEGELAVARAARKTGHQMMLSTQSTVSLEQINEAREAPVWFQLYPTERFSVTQAVLRRAEQAGCSVVALTVDVTGRKTERVERFRRSENAECQVCHRATTFAEAQRRKPMFDGIDVTGVVSVANRAMDWEYVDRLRDATTMKVVIKGLERADDAALAVEHGVDGIVVSNHGARALDTGLSTIELLPEIVSAVAGRIPVLIDSGFRRGTDVAKALALGAAAVMVGRPYLWGLGAFGQPGVERVLEILERELDLTMRQLGARSLAELDSSMVRVR